MGDSYRGYDCMATGNLGNIVTLGGDIGEIEENT